MAIKKTQSGHFEVAHTVDGVLYHVGIFDTIELARDAEQSFKGYAGATSHESEVTE